MTEDALRAELAAGVTFIGWELDGNLAAVMARQTVRDATLIRHAYVRPEFQGRGIGGVLLERLRSQAKGRLLVGTWADAVWAVRFYEHHGFRMAPRDETTVLLKTYWNVPDRQRDVSVVLEGRAIF
jgi:GNAT superfamily N-acetyltransferase